MTHKHTMDASDKDDLSEWNARGRAHGIYQRSADAYDEAMAEPRRLYLAAIQEHGSVLNTTRDCADADYQKAVGAPYTGWPCDLCKRAYVPPYLEPCCKIEVTGLMHT